MSNMRISAGSFFAGGVVAGVLSVVGVLGNIATLWAIGRNKKLRKQPTTVLMLSLTTADLVYCLLVLPFTAMNFLECCCW